MADDERPDGRDPGVAEWLQVEPLDDVTRRRLVSTALRETDAVDAPASTDPSPAWRWIAAAAAVVVILVGGLALLSAPGGHDDEQATSDRTATLAPKALGQALSVAPDVGDFGNLDDAANLAALRAALDRPSAELSASPQAASDAAGATPPSIAGCARGAIGTVIARASGTIDGLPVTVVLLQGADGTRSIDALFQDGCEVRHLSGPTP